MRVIHLARKPLIGTVAANTLEHGAGALNIDACRAGYTSEADLALTKMKNPGKDGELVTSNVYGAGRPQQSVNTSGRWPNNVVLQHLEACRRDGTKRVKGQNPQFVHEGKGGTRAEGYGLGGRPAGVGIGYADEDGKETVEAWSCAPGCPVAALDNQSGDRASGGSPAAQGRKVGLYEDGLKQRVITPYTDTGGASRYFKQVGGEPCE